MSQPVVLTEGMHCAVPWGAMLQFALKWDYVPGKTADLDASCVIFNDRGSILDAVFYNQLSSRDGSIHHSGDCKAGEYTGDDEVITLNTAQIHPEVKALVFMINCHSVSDSFSSVQYANASLRDPHAGATIANVSFPHRGGAFTAVLLAILYRDDVTRTWQVKNVSATGNGSNWKESEPLMRKELEFLIPREVIQEAAVWDAHSLKAYQLEKGLCLRVPNLTHVTMGLGWDIKGGRTVDLDSSIICLGKNAESIETVYFGNKKNSNHSIKHSGDNLTGEGEGDDEQITIDLREVPSEVEHMFCTVTIFSQAANFGSVNNAYCRLVNRKTNQEVCRYTLREVGNENAVIMCQISRDSNHSDWKILALGDPASGHIAQDVIPVIRSRYFKHVIPDTVLSSYATQQTACTCCVM